MTPLPSLNGLRTFEAAARLGSFSDAARELSVTHGAVSRGIAALEAWLEVPLFVRAGKRVALTDAGRAYAREIGPAFDRLAMATADLLRRRERGVLRVDSLPTVAMRWLIPRLPRFQAAHPGVELRLVTSERAPLAEADAFDVAIRRGPERWAGLRATRFLDERATPMCAPSLLRKRALARPEELAKQTWIEIDSRPDAWARWLSAQRLEGLRPARTLRFDRYFLAIEAARDGLGVVMGSRPILEDDLVTGALVAPFEARQVPARSYYALVRKGRVPPAAAKLVAWLVAEGAPG